MRPLCVAETAWTGSGRTTPMTSTPSVVSAMRRLRAGSAAAVMELQATTSSLAPRASSSSAISSAKASSSAAERSPYGKRAVSPRYRKSSCGSWTRSSCSTVRPPTPESKTAIGRRRGSAGRGGTGRDASPGCLRAPAGLVVLLDVVDRRAELAGDLAGDVVAVAALDRGDRVGEHAGDEQHDRRVLDRALAALAVAGEQPPVDLGVRAAERAVQVVHRGLPPRACG